MKFTWRMAVIGVLLVVLARANVWLVPRAARHRVVVRWGQGAVSARLNGDTKVTIDRPPGLTGNRCGVYVFHPCGEARGQHFQNVILRRYDPGRGKRLLRYHLLDPARDAPRLQADDDWQIEAGRGLRHDGSDCERAVLLLPPDAGTSGELAVELRHPVDAGLMICASDPRNGLVFVVRPQRNDAYFFQLIDGAPGPVLGLAPVRTLTAGDEAVRLLALLGRLGVRAALAVGLFWIVMQLGGRCRIAPPARVRLSRWLRGAVLLLVPAAATAWIAMRGLEQIPHLADETAYWFQARVFAAGRLWAPVPAHPEFFAHDHICMLGDRWLAKYPPMYPILLALGMRLGFPGLVNPMLAALLAAGVFALAGRWRGRAAAWPAWGLLVSSPFFLFMGANLMSHMAAATLLVWFLIAGRSALMNGRMKMAVAAGAALGAAVLTRPYTALLFGGVVLAGGLGYAVRNRMGKRVLRLLAGLAAGLGPFAVLGAVWLSAFAVDAVPGVPINVYALYDASDTLGFGPDKGKGWLKTWGTWGHSPAKALRSVRFYLEHTATHFLGWPWALSLMWLPVPFFVRRHRGRYLLLLGVMFALVGGHMFYWATQHIGYGARYWFTGVPLAAVLAGIGFDTLVRSVEGRDRSRAGARIVGGLGIGLLVVWSAVIYIPAHMEGTHDYGHVSAALKKEVRRRELKDALIFVQTENLLFNDGFFMNDPFFRAGPIFARDLGARNADLMAAYPDYAVYRWDKTALHKLRDGAEGKP